MPAEGLWVPGAVWEFQQNLRSLSTTGVQVVQSSTEPTTWQWEYTIQTDDLPLLDTVGRGDVPPDMFYGCLVNFWFLNNSGATQSYNCRVEVQSATLGTFQSSVGTRSNVPNNNYVYFSSRIHSVGVGTTLRARLWGTAGHNLAGIRLVLVPMVTPPLSDVLLLAENISVSGQSDVGSMLGVFATANWNLSTYAVNNALQIQVASSGYPVFLLPLRSTFFGGMIDWLGGMNGNARLIIITSANLSIQYSNGYYGVYDITMRLLDVRFGHLFRNLAGVSKF
jgi:hypothetical protein